MSSSISTSIDPSKYQSDMDCTDDTLLPYAEVWKMSRKTFPMIFEDKNKENCIDKLKKVMMKSHEHFYVYVPQNFIPRKNYLQSLPHYIDFTRGSLGDLVKVLCKQDMAAVHNLCVDTQNSVLNYLAEKNQQIFTIVMKEYIFCLKDLVNGRAKFRKEKDMREFSFKRFMSTTNSELSEEYMETPFVISSSSSCITVLSQVLKVIQTQLNNLNRCTPLSVRPLWKILLDFVEEDNNLLIQVAVMNTLATMIRELGFPEDFMSGSKLCMFIKGIIRHLMMNYKGDCSKNETVSLLFKSLCQVFDATVEETDLKIEYNDVLLKIVLTSVTSDSPFLCTEIASRSTCRLIHFLLERSRNQVNLEDRLNSLVPLVVDCNSLLLIFQHIIYKDYLCNTEDKLTKSLANISLVNKSNCTPTITDGITTSMTYISVRKEVMKYFEEIRLGQINKGEFRKKSQFLVMYFKMIAELHLKINEHKVHVKFFDEMFFKSFADILLNLGSIEFGRYELLNFIKMCQYLLFLPEVRNMDNILFHKIVFFLFIPWLEKMITMARTVEDSVATFIVTYRKAGLENILFQDVDVMKSCLKAFAFVEGDRFLNYRKLALKIAMSNPLLISTALKCVPFLILCCTAKDSPSIVFDFLVIAFATSEPTVQLILSQLVPLTICALSGSCRVVKGTEDSAEEFILRCRLCDDGLKFQSNRGNLNVRDLMPIVSQYISLSKSTEKVREHVAKSLRRLTNHLQELNCPELLSSLLVFMEDEEHQVRMAFSKVACHLVISKKFIQNSNSLHYKDDREKTEQEKSINRFIQLAFLTVHKSLKISNRDNMLLQFSIMATIYNVGCLPLREVLLPIIKMYILLISHPNMLNLSVAQIHLKGIASAHNQTIQDIFYKLQDEICQVLVITLVHNFISDAQQVPNTLTIIARAFGFPTAKELVECTFEDQILKYLLPWLVKKPRVKELLYIVGGAAYERERIPECIKKAFQNIYPHIKLFESDTVVAEICSMISELTNTPFNSLVFCSFKVIMCELLLYIHKKRERIIETLMVMKELESNVTSGEEKIGDELMKNNKEGKKLFKSNKDIANFIQTRFLGVLAFLDGKLVSSSGCESVKKNVLHALPELIKIMGTEHITPVRFKVLATLRSALNLYKDCFPHLIFSAFLAYVQNVEPSALGSLMSTIFVCLLPLLDEFPVEIGSIFNILVIQNSDAVSPHLADLYFVPDTPPTQVVFKKVQQTLAKLRKMPVKYQLEASVRQASHENTEVRLRGLKKLCDDLSLYRQEISGIIFENDKTGSLIMQLLDVLLTGSRDDKDDILLACGECLGEFGALDPGHLPNKISLNVEDKELTSIESDTFITGALKELVRALLAANHTIVVDRFAFAIQELLKIYDIPKSRENVWKSLPSATKEIIIPLFNSRYVNSHPNDTSNQSSIPHPIFGNLNKCDWQAWAFHWVSRLITFVTNEKAFKVFSYCKFGFKNDMQTLLFFLPYIILYAILPATENQRKLITEEINAVLFWIDDKPNKKEKVTSYKIKNISHTLDEAKSTFNDYIRTHKLCIKTVYELFDFLNQELRLTKSMVHRDKTSVPNIQNVEEILKSFSKLETAQVAFDGKDYPRALLYMEEHVKEKPHMLQEALPLLGKIYCALNDPDSFKGIIDIHENEPTAHEMILYHEVTNQLQDAAACYEHLSQENIHNEGFHKSMVQCYLRMDQPATALHVADGLLSSWEENTPDLLDEQAEAMLSLSKYDELEELLSKKHMTHNSGWGVRLGKSLLHIRKGEGEQMLSEVNNMRIDLVRALSTTSITECEYRQGYDNIVKLHILNEFEKLGKMILKMQNMTGLRAEEEVIGLFKHLVDEELADRLKLTHPSCRVLHPVLCMRRVVLTLAYQMLKPQHPNVGDLFLKEIGNIWLKSIEITRKSNSFQQAYSNILTAENYKPKGLFIEKAKLLWSKAEPDAALTTLKRGIEHHFPDVSAFKSMPESEKREDRKICAEAKLLIATYNDENVNKDLDKNLAIYREALDVYKFWEKSIVCLAQYEYKVLRAISDTDCSSKVQDLQTRIINNFGKSLEYGCEYIYQSVPRMLSVWLDCGAKLAGETKPGRNAVGNVAEKKAHLLKLTGIIECYVNRLPPYIFMTAFSQLISRICHPSPECYMMLKHIIVNIILNYEGQALWMFISVYKSKFMFRKNRCEEVLRSHEIQKRPELFKLIKVYKDLAEKLYELANKTVVSRREVIRESITTLYPPLYQVVTHPDTASILIPLQRFRTIALPRTMNKEHSPFPTDVVYISGMKDEVQILTSLQRPKKIILIGSDGKEHPLLCKPKDDIRLDARMMEFSSIINLYLHRDPEARNRGLHIRTYSAVPLTDDCGLIEWLPNLEGLRPIMMKIYKEKGLTLQNKDTKTKTLICDKNDSLEKKLDIFVNKLLPRHPPVLPEFFLKEFHHPTAWYLARSAYVRTAAVMSIVGNILGLGDRHGENILLDTTCGDLIHVDFGCLFNKGEFFEWPERVPFRLTHNMVSAMGPTGVEGMFKHACEITTRVMRQQIDQLMSVLSPFLYDPLVTWNSKKSRDENSEMTNEKAFEWIQNIENRLQGTLRRREKPLSIPLSVEGQVRCLIQEATSIENLCQMFYGWGPHL